MIHNTSPVERAPEPLRKAVEAAQAAFNADPTEQTCDALKAAIDACIRHDLEQRTDSAA